ncbi:hypothetical protein OG230_22475 [Streptomyces sp. NBC_00234]|uniref:hypothetical protein n=1 Tax=Streptomyces sp. NBC_00234 TaxID=2903638 RepID=UPI002E2C42C8|nr:hypothetical protein [Streptomyces sp. NBC_00234]
MKTAAVFAALALAAVGCTSDEPEPAPPVSQPCQTDPGTPEGKFVRQLLDADDYRTRVEKAPDDLADGLKEELKARAEPGRTEFRTPMCSFALNYPRGSGSDTLSVDFHWTSRESPKGTGRPADTHAFYNVNGHYGESDETLSVLHVECALPGKLGTLSQQNLLVASASNTSYVGTAVKQEVRDRQIHFLYLMARQATEALGCENEPLKKDPVVKGYKTPEEAAKATP